MEKCTIAENSGVDKWNIITTSLELNQIISSQVTRRSQQKKAATWTRIFFIFWQIFDIKLMIFQSFATPSARSILKIIKNTTNLAVTKIHIYLIDTNAWSMEPIVADITSYVKLLWIILGSANAIQFVFFNRSGSGLTRWSSFLFLFRRLDLFINTALAAFTTGIALSLIRISSCTFVIHFDCSRRKVKYLIGVILDPVLHSCF